MEKAMILYPNNAELNAITKNPIGRTLKKPIPLTDHQQSTLQRIPKGLSSYILESCCSYYPSLIPLVLENESVLAVARYLYRYKSKSAGSLIYYCYCIHKFSQWLGKAPDQIIAEAKNDNNANLNGLLEDYVNALEDEKLSPRYIKSSIAAIKSFYMVNGITITLPFRLPGYIRYKDRAPTPEELMKLIDIADLREKVIVSMLALGGFRIGTLAQLKYYHVKDDLESNITPLHIHVEASITKGKYHDYDTFLGQEAVDYLKAYLDLRKRGSPSGKIPPETITDESPLIRASNTCYPKPITAKQIHELVHNLYIKAGILQLRSGSRFNLRVHSIRKFFRTQLAALGVPQDYVESCMGHKISTYHDIEMKGIEFLRNIYAASGLSIKPKAKVSRIEMLKEIVRAWGMSPEEILTKEALSIPHRTYVSSNEREDDQIYQLGNALKEMLRKELLNP